MVKEEVRTPSINYKILASLLLGSLVLLIIGATGLFNFVSYSPKEIRTTNLYDRSATVSWLTARSGKGKVFVSTSSWRVTIPFLNNFLANSFDDQLSAKTHFVTVKNLLPNQKYYFSVPASFQIYSFSTKQTPETFNLPSPAYGVIVGRDGKTPARDALVFINENFSTFTNSSGGWTFDLSVLPKAKTIGMEIISAQFGKAKINIDANRVQPVQTIQLK